METHVKSEQQIYEALSLLRGLIMSRPAGSMVAGGDHVGGTPGRPAKRERGRDVCCCGE